MCTTFRSGETSGTQPTAPQLLAGDREWLVWKGERFLLQDLLDECARDGHGGGQAPRCISITVGINCLPELVSFQRGKSGGPPSSQCSLSSSHTRKCHSHVLYQLKSGKVSGILPCSCCRESCSDAWICHKEAPSSTDSTLWPPWSKGL